MTDTVITLGDFQFRNLEIPASINFGGEQKLNVHELVGGTRIIDALGHQEDDVSWNGLITGPDALDRAAQLDNMRIAGDQVTLSWFNFNYLVVIKYFRANTERYYQINYSITLTVVQELSLLGAILSLLGIDAAILNDVTVANGLASSINIPTLTSLMGALTLSVNAVPTFKGASQSTINSVLTPLKAVTANVTTQLASAHSRLFGV